MREHEMQSSLSDAATRVGAAESPEGALHHNGLDVPDVPGFADTSRGYVKPASISPVVRVYFWDDRWPRLSPYFEHNEYRIFVEADPYKTLVERFPDEVPLYELGYLWCTCYSTACVNGEGGHHHMSMLTPITPERFRAAKAKGWNL
jgi:hypothetical protein